jgi:hypothetical protein
MRTRRIMLSSAACPALAFFPHYYINGTIFGKTLLNIKCVFWFSLQLLSETFLILRIIQRDIIKSEHASLCKVPVFSCQILIELEFSRFSKKYSYIKFHEHPQPLHADGRTDMTKLTAAFRNFANAPKNSTESHGDKAHILFGNNFSLVLLFSE